MLRLVTTPTAGKETTIRRQRLRDLPVVGVVTDHLSCCVAGNTTAGNETTCSCGRDLGTS
jgi:hypothetical protein